MTSPLEVALSYLDALGRDDPDAVAALVTDDFHNEHQSAIGSGCTGRDAYRARLPGFMASLPDREYVVIETIGSTVAASDGSPDDGEQIVAVRYRLRADVDGTRIDIPGVMWFGVRDGLIARRIDTWDSLTFLRQTGQEPPPVDG